MGKQARLKRERTANRERVVTLYGELAGPILLKQFTPNCCINGTRVFVETMKHFGVPARAQVVSFEVYNARWIQRMSAKGSCPASDAEMQMWLADGAWALGAIAGSDGDNFPYHLIGVANGVLVDSAFGQANRPAKNIVVDQVLTAKVAPDFGVPGSLCSGEIAGGCYVIYKPEQSVAFEHISGWQRSPWNLAVAAEMIQAIQARL
jgi:hypothetical protein